MKAIGYRTPGDVGVLTELEMQQPTLGPRDLLVAVKAVSINPADVKRREFEPPDPAAGFRILGYDAAGVVEAVGSEVSFFRPGDEVFYAGAMDRPGTNAELHAVDERIVGPKPKTLSFAEAAALPLTSITAWEILFDRMQAPQRTQTPSGSLLIVNGAGGVGSMMIQLARRLTGLTVIATASRPETTDWVRQLGAEHVADHRLPLDQAIKEIGFDGVDYLAALTTTPGVVPGLVRAMNPQGHVTFIDNFDESIAPFKPKSLTVSWEMMFTRSLFQTPDMAAQHQILKKVAALVDAGEVRTTVTQISGPLTAESLRAAHRVVESGRAIGKVVVAAA